MPRPPQDEFLTEGRVYPCISSNVRSASYDDEENILYVTYHNGSEYAYLRQNVIKARSFWYAPSKGKWIWTYIRVRGSKTAHQCDYYLLEAPKKPRKKVS